MAVTVTADKVAIMPSGVVYITWGDGTQTEYPSLDAVKSGLLEFGDDPELAKRLFLASWLARNPDGSHLNWMAKRQLTFDIQAVKLIDITQVV